MQKLAFTLAVILGSAAAQAADFHVTRTDDPVPGACLATDCSVREAVIAANAAPGADRVVLGAGSYYLTRIDTTPSSHDPTIGPLWVTSSIAFVGAGAASTRLRWRSSASVGYSNQVIWFNEPVANASQVGINAMTISHGRGGQGGCIYFYGTGSTLSLVRSTIESCTAGSNGGALYLLDGALELSSATFRLNAATSHGGAMELIGDIAVTSRSTRIIDNSAGGNGGGVYIWGNGYIGWTTEIDWLDLGGTTVSDNVAAGTGGGVLVTSTATAYLRTDASAATNRWLTISNNVAGGVGGGLHNSAPFGNYEQVSMERVRVIGNQASEGGGIATSSALNLVDVEIAQNQAQTGAGGGLQYLGAVEWPRGRSLRRVGFRDNQAATGGGAISSACASFSAQDVSFHLNQASGSGRGQTIEADGNVTLRHATLYGNNSTPVIGSPGLYKRHNSSCSGTSIKLQNSLIGDYCGTQLPGGLVSDGGNQFGPDASACPALSGVDQRQASNSEFFLGFGAYGGAFEIVGWAGYEWNVPQRNFGLASWCSDTDVRGFQRTDGLCDSGAFEQTIN